MAIYKSYRLTTRPNRRGIVYTTILEDHGSKGIMAQLTKSVQHDPMDLHSDTLVLDHYPTIEEACQAVGYPIDIAGLPKLR